MTLHADLTTQRQFGPVHKSHCQVQLRLLLNCDAPTTGSGNVIQVRQQPRLMQGTEIQYVQTHTLTCGGTGFCRLVISLVVLCVSHTVDAGMEERLCLSQFPLHDLVHFWAIPLATLCTPWSCRGAPSPTCSSTATGCTSPATACTSIVTGCNATVSSTTATHCSSRATGCTHSLGPHCLRHRHHGQRLC